MNFVEEIRKYMKNEKYTFNDLWLRLPESLRTACEKCEQDAKYHPEGVVSEHIRMVFEWVDKNYDDVDLLLAAIFHDLGKPETQTYREKDGVMRISHIGHENKCKYYIDKYFHLYSDISTNQEKITEICINHMKSHYYLDGSMTKASKRKAFEDLKYFEDIVNFSKADNGGRG